jgi:uncharacterized membrane-anchored protein
MFTVIIAIPAVAYWKLRMNAIVAFWFAYVVTRPLGASYADWLGVSHARGGVGLGRGPVALILTVFIIGFVGFLAVTRKDIEQPAEAAPGKVPARARHRR